MKKIIISIVIFIILIFLALLIIHHPQKEKLNKIKLAEVTHSVFYAPQYAAKTLGYFEEEGLDVDIILTPGADKVTAAVLSGDADIGFCGSEATIYVYNEGEKDYLINFSGLTKRDGSFLVSRKKIQNFTLDNLKGKYIVGGRKGGMPEMTLEWALKQNGIDVNKDVTIDTSIEFAAMSGAFISGTGDFVTLFDPNALKLEQEGYGYVVASIGELGGVVPYTAYNTRKSYLENHKDEIKGFVKAIQKGLDYVYGHTDEEVAEVILSEFPDTSLNDLEAMVKRYRDIDAWFKTTYIEEKDFNHIMEIMEAAGELSKSAPFNKLVDNSFSLK